MTRSRLKRLADFTLRWRFVLPAVGALWGIYIGVLHPWLMRWGATPAEVAATLPGDTLAPDSYFTRAVTIDAPPSTVWPWIVQIGQDRAGFYSNTWLENLTGADIHNGGGIHPAWQRRAIGDRVPLTRQDLFGGMATLGRTEIVALEPERMIADIPGRFVLQPIGSRATRLLFREQLASQGPRVSRWLAWDPVHFVMVQRMLRGIKERAEGERLVPRPLAWAARVGWLLAGAGLLGLFLARPRFRPWLLLPILPAAASLSTTGDFDAALAAFLAVGITVAGRLELGRRWWPPWVLIACAVLMTLLLAPDPHTAIGLGFLAVAAGLFAASPQRVW